MSVVIVLATSVAACAALLWLQDCNQRTFHTRQRIIRGWRRVEDWPAASVEFDAVSYHSHVWTLFFFRDASNLYGPITKAIMAEAAP